MDKSSSTIQEDEHTSAGTAFAYNTDPWGRLETRLHRHLKAFPHDARGARRRMQTPYEKGDELQSDDWALLEEGIYVLVERDNGPVLGGEVDELTRDASVVWIWLDGGRGRIALFRDEGTRVWMPKGYEFPALDGISRDSLDEGAAVEGGGRP
ncbi:hypothetical protein [Arthrobacter sp. YN]|uniref:hypothetical protein n=1 Tax=Arthrobacter sp. YN TaxID=2020486 RepID=UPI000B60996C|nr:hypothetical protein [Arthrobacter sp. YN]ASN20011.1 hypothetical protein CGK93_10230 [Arthrobacter sp. YN]